MDAPRGRRRSVVFDHQIFVWQRYGGASRYFVELASRLPVRGFEVHVVAPYYINRHLRHVPQTLVAGRAIPQIRGLGALTRKANFILAGPRIRRIRPAVIHRTFFGPNVSESGTGAAEVVTVFDMINEKLPEYFPAGDTVPERKRRAVRRADHVVCISAKTRSDLLELVDLEPEKVSVTHLGLDLRGTSSARTIRPLDAPYILFVGHRGGYKNFRILLRALAGRSRLAKDWRLVCFGGNPFDSGEIEAMKSLPSGAVLRVSGDDSELSRWYAHADVFVYPSLYEGFGIPPLEAMAHGCPVVCANAGSIPEVVGDAAVLFDPASPESLAEALDAVLGSESKAEALRQAGQRRIRRYSWDRCAEETAAIYERL